MYQNVSIGYLHPVQIFASVHLFIETFLFQDIFASKLTWKLKMSSLEPNDKCGGSNNIKRYINHFILPSKMRIREEANYQYKNTFIHLFTKLLEDQSLL